MPVDQCFRDDFHCQIGKGITLRRFCQNRCTARGHLCKSRRRPGVLGRQILELRDRHYLQHTGKNLGGLPGSTVARRLPPETFRHGTDPSPGRHFSDFHPHFFVQRPHWSCARWTTLWSSVGGLPELGKEYHLLHQPGLYPSRVSRCLPVYCTGTAGFRGSEAHDANHS